MTDLTQMVENLIADPVTFPLDALAPTTLAQLHDAVRRESGKTVLSSESTEVRGNWFAYGPGRAVKVRRHALEETINKTALTIRKQRAISQAVQERSRPERELHELREALAKADPQLLRVMWTAMQQFVDNQDECAEESSAEVKLVEPLIEKFDAYFASKAN